ncbi:hypothetical protein [Nonomuraea sp. NPDC049695]|uniref:hypothetical protein n=1 Tax=Nonomuraea sp. NPDC049695 TaxID=3154734 RepID=UPI00342E2CFF
MSTPIPSSGGEEHARHDYPHDRSKDDERSLAGDDSPRVAADDELEAASPRADDDKLVARDPRADDDEYAAAGPGAVAAPEDERDVPYREPYAGTGGGDMPAERDLEPDLEPDADPVAAGEAPAHAAAPEEVVLFDQDPDQVQARWRELQTAFVDDPGEAVRRADGLVGEVVEALTSSLTSRTDSLRDRWKDADSTDTEQLRLALREYRSVLESLLTLSGRR